MSFTALGRQQARDILRSIRTASKGSVTTRWDHISEHVHVQRPQRACKSLGIRKPMAIRLFTSSARASEDLKERPTPPTDIETRSSGAPITPLKTQLKVKLAALSSTKSHENIYTLPNFLTFTRLIAAPAVGYLILHNQQLWAVSLFAYAGITDLVDGWIARRWKLQTVIGSVVDPMADKMLMTIVVVCLAVQGGLPCKSALKGYYRCRFIANNSRDQYGSPHSSWDVTSP